MNTTNLVLESTQLRQRALTYLRNRPLKQSVEFSPEEMLILIHELEVLQIELELQNTELIAARAVSNESSDTYTELFDYAPTGYFTVSEEGDIMELNHSLINMLDRPYTNLKDSKFGFFVSEDTKPVFNLFLQNAFANKTTEYCEVSLTTKDNVIKSVYLTGIVIGNNKQCLINIIDIAQITKSAH